MTCTECGRVFDLFDQTDAQEWYYGHDCESVAVCAAVGLSGVGGLGVASIVCPACGAAAGSWCVRHGRTQAGPSLACVARVRAARSAVGGA